jgi:hypothetical protein
MIYSKVSTYSEYYFNALDDKITRDSNNSEQDPPVIFDRRSE